jgi:hypothetical protein
VLQEVVIQRLRAAGWQVWPEVSFSIFGERGVIDILAWHAATRTLLIIEIKTLLVDFGDLLATMDRRLRLAWRIAADRGLAPLFVGGWVAVRDTATNRRRRSRGARTSSLSGGWPHHRGLAATPVQGAASAELSIRCS